MQYLFSVELPYLRNSNVFVEMQKLDMSWEKFNTIINELKETRRSCLNLKIHPCTGVLVTDKCKLRFNIFSESEDIVFCLFDFDNTFIEEKRVTKNESPSNQFMTWVDNILNVCDIC